MKVNKYVLLEKYIAKVKATCDLKNPFTAMIFDKIPYIRLQRLAKVYDSLKEIKVEDVKVEANYSDISLIIYDLKHLTKARRMIGTLYPDYKAEVNLIYPSGDEAIVLWKDTSRMLTQDVMIRLEVPISEFPESLNKEGCGFKKEEITNESYICNTYSCNY